LHIDVLKVKGKGFEDQRNTVGELFAGYMPKLKHHGDANGTSIYKAYCNV